MFFVLDLVDHVKMFQSFVFETNLHGLVGRCLGLRWVVTTIVSKSMLKLGGTLGNYAVALCCLDQI